MSGEQRALEGRVALVTGGGTGIGRATSLELARSGARVVVCGRRSEPLTETAREVEAEGGECVAVAADIRDDGDRGRVVAAALDRFGAVDVLVNNAGGQFSAPAAEISLNGWNGVHGLAVGAAWDLTRTVAVSSMIPRRRGVILFIGFSPRRGLPGFVHASAARAALENLAGGLAIEWSQFGIRAVCVALGTIETEALAGYGSESLDQWRDQIPLGRFGRPEDVARLLRFLASDDAAFITGTTVTMDGGADAWGLGYPPPKPARRARAAVPRRR